MADTRDSHQEIEFKLDLGSFANYLKLVGFLGQIDGEERQQSGFFDTADRRLSRTGWALRVRAEGNRGLVTAKGPAQPTESAFVREEVEAEIDRSLALAILGGTESVLQLDIPPVAILRETIGDSEIGVRVRIDNTRQKKSFRIGDHDYVLEIDRTEFPHGHMDYELEVEIPDLSRLLIVEDGLRKLFASLDIPFERQTASKLARALRHAGLE